MYNKRTCLARVSNWLLTNLLLMCNDVCHQIAQHTSPLSKARLTPLLKIKLSFVWGARREWKVIDCKQRSKTQTCWACRASSMHSSTYEGEKSKRSLLTWHLQHHVFALWASVPVPWNMPSLVQTLHPLQGSCKGLVCLLLLSMKFSQQIEEPIGKD